MGNKGEAHAQLGAVYLSQKDYTLAEKALRCALELDPDHHLANFNLLLLYRRTRDERAEQQAHRFEAVKQKQAEEAKSSLRRIEVIRPQEPRP